MHSEQASGKDHEEGAVERGIRDWIASNFSAQVISIERLARWRPQWKVRFDKGGDEDVVFFRGNRPIAPRESLHFEMEVMQVLEQQGIKVPHIYGWCEEPVAFVMDWIDTEDRDPGMLHTAIENAATLSEDRWQALQSYMGELANVHEVPVHCFSNVSRLAAPPVTPKDIALHAVERMYRLGAITGNIDPVFEFLQAWLRRNVPAHRSKASFIAGDAGQFMSHGAQVVALMDFEIADIGDTHWDLATLRGRHPLENMGDIPALYRCYEKASGTRVDLEVVCYYTAAFLQLSGIAAKLFMTPEAHGANWIEGMLEYASITRRALEAIAELQGIELDYNLHLPEPDCSPLEESGLKKLMVDIDVLPTSGAFEPWERKLLHSIPEFLLNYSRYRNWYDQQTLADFNRVTAEPSTSVQDAESRLLQQIQADDPALDTALVRCLHARALRLCMVIAGTDPCSTNPLFHRLDRILGQ